MKGEEAKKILGFPPCSSPTPAEIKAAYKNRVWESHPDLFPSHQKLQAESNFKLVSEAYSSLLSDDPVEEFIAFIGFPEDSVGFNLVVKLHVFNCSRAEGSAPVANVRVMKTGFPRGKGSNRSSALIQFPFILLVLGTVALGGINATRAYRKQKDTYPSHNPFLP